MADVPESRIIAWMRLARVPLLGPVLIKRCIDALGTPEAVLDASPSRLAAIEGIGRQRAQSFAKGVPEDDARREFDLAAQHGINVLTPDHPSWPPGLKTIPDPPIVLYLRGTLEPADALAVGVVGSRNCTLYGREQAERFGALLAQAGLAVVSGGARGIDTGAHEGALRAKGRTVVVQGCGMLHTYPPENRGLYDRIVEANAGAVLSELPLNTAPTAENFPPRNRIIAGMSLGVLVVEANTRSGSLITARLAADDYNREVFAIPGRVDSPASSGTHHLIKTGAAHLVENIADILDALGDVGDALRQPPSPAPTTASAPAAIPQPTLFTPETPALKFTSAQQKILNALAAGDAAIDDLIERTALPPAVLMAEVTMLQIRGALQRTPGNRIALRKSPT